MVASDGASFWCIPQANETGNDVQVTDLLHHCIGNHHVRHQRSTIFLLAFFFGPKGKKGGGGGVPISSSRAKFIEYLDMSRKEWGKGLVSLLPCLPERRSQRPLLGFFTRMYSLTTLANVVQSTHAFASLTDVVSAKPIQPCTKRTASL